MKASENRDAEVETFMEVWAVWWSSHGDFDCRCVCDLSERTVPPHQEVDWQEIEVKDDPAST